MRDIDTKRARASQEDLRKLRRLETGRGDDGFRKYIKQYRKTFGYEGDTIPTDDIDIYFACLENYNDLDKLED